MAALPGTPKWRQTAVRDEADHAGVHGPRCRKACGRLHKSRILHKPPRPEFRGECPAPAATADRVLVIELGHVGGILKPSCPEWAQKLQLSVRSACLRLDEVIPRWQVFPKGSHGVCLRGHQVVREAARFCFVMIGQLWSHH